ncbi:hypothetical protein EYB53_023610 [Candidatus Chloroploca sp. M-50]|uniref:Uncharacterized protein n=1 Tax=Candidatus Chloroploca mongolica TaxID=2528176 RepID=A0ABS4DH16_9CHLR|nr:hypothetical protein [Candidatus Chloroploca mongolica]MBP1468722.1 hypothetical protein [Candidatus Chloroploca mongolica]
MLEATVRRLLGTEMRVKEFANNIFRSNQPECFNLWLMQRTGGKWSTPEAPLSLDFAYEGRPAAMHSYDGVLWLFYHAVRSGRTGIWYKTLRTLSLDVAALYPDDPEVFQRHLANGSIFPELLEFFEQQNMPLSLDLTLDLIDSTEPQTWRLTDRQSRLNYILRGNPDRPGTLLVSAGWDPGRPLIDQPQINAYPAVVPMYGLPWVFWEAFDQTTRRWSLDQRFMRGNEWITRGVWFSDGAEAEVERRRPLVLAAGRDAADGMWLFWFERRGPNWQLRYRYTNEAEQLRPVFDFPSVQGASPDLDSGLAIVFHATQNNLWAFWSHRGDPEAPGRWRISGVTLPNDGATGSTPLALPLGTPLDADDREPAAISGADGSVELYWSSNRSGRWSIWRCTCNATTGWGPVEQITVQQNEDAPDSDDAYNRRAPFPLAAGADTLLFYRSSASLAHSGSSALDARYAGCTTADTRNIALHNLRGTFEDFTAYSYDTRQTTGEPGVGWYANEAVGLYPLKEEQPLISSEAWERIAGALRQHLPIQVRIVPIIKENDHG